MSPEQRRVLVASALGTVFEWYDFYLYGSLAGIIGDEFFAGLDRGSAFIFALLAFASGFLVRPFGALLFGRLGDLIGRKYTFLVTILLMGLSTFIAGLLPGYAAIGVAAPMILVALRLLQGLALGGEYGGAATYVGEYAPRMARGAYTSWLQTTATLGLLFSLLVNVGLRRLLGNEAFAAWGWRLPFLASSALLAVSVWMRLRLNESPAFVRIRRAGRTSKAPLSEALGRGPNLRRVLVALFGMTAGQGVIWYTGQFYVLVFLTHTLKVDGGLAGVLIGISLVLAIPLFWVFGRLSDRVGRRPVMLAGCLLAALGYFPMFHALTAAANPALARAMALHPVVLLADPADCSFPLRSDGGRPFTHSCDIAKQALSDVAVDYRRRDARGPARIEVGGRSVAAFNASGLSDAELARRQQQLQQDLRDAVSAAGYPRQADPREVNRPLVVLILTLLVADVALVYGPIAASLVELFPTRIRYTSMGLPYNLGNGWFGGLVPTVAFALVAHDGGIYHGLWYPVIVAAGSFLIGALLLPETRGTDLSAGD
ncbi:MAG: MFS transporter [Betaproteobacteria bacterium]|nr:MFS transporter [Betaproteobacteria bacterium]MDE1955074.1 MFS transporter [Betaproteobacteria bacterium]MDE2152088.1 MFS transporter [Betaproteobacteria bacterium]